MSQAEDLLNSLSDDMVIENDVSVIPHIIISDDRTTKVPSELQKLGVQYDHNVKTVTFDCPRYANGLDMSTMCIYINYQRKDSYEDMYPVKNLTIDQDDSNVMHFDWEISRNVTAVADKISFNVCVKNVDENDIEINHWNSELNSECYISKGLECSEQIAADHEDVITTLLEKAADIDNDIETLQNAANNVSERLTIGEEAILDLYSRINSIVDGNEVAY